MLGVWACQEPAQPPMVRRRTTPIPEHSRTSPSARSDQNNTIAVSPEKATPLLKGNIIRRFATPGSVRWSRNLGKPITFIRWTPLAGLIISAGNEVHNVTSQGVHRWKFIAGKGHRLFKLGDEEIVWSPAFGRLNQLLRRGRKGWSRRWDSKLAADDLGGIYLLDASTVAAIGAVGRDRWRVSLEGVRKLDDPFTCKDGVLFQGISGLKRDAVLITNRGTVIRKTALKRSAVLIDASPTCEPLVWQDGEISLLDARGQPIWRHPSRDLPFVHRLEGGFSIVTGQAGRPALFEVVTNNGYLAQSVALPVQGRLTAVQVLPQVNLGVEAIGFCLDVTSPCARPDKTRGPFNALVTSLGNNKFGVLVQHVQGNLSFAQYPDGGLVIASSKDADATDLVLRDEGHQVVWQVNLPGRLSSGPYVGPSGEVYVGTCREWECSAPHLLIAVTGKKLPPKEK